MIMRYTSAEMASLWSEDAKLSRWRDVAVAVAHAQYEMGVVPAEALDQIRAAPVPLIERVRQIEADTRHDVVAFIKAFTEPMDTKTAGFVHRNLTSSDIVDTAQAMALRTANNWILAEARRFTVALGSQSLKHRNTVCVGRTHGQAAAPDVFGHRLADFAFAVERSVVRLEAVGNDLAVVNLTGPVGTGINLSPRLRELVASRLNLGVPNASTQVIFRDALATWVADLAVLGGICEAFATDVRLGAHDGVAELSEGQGPYQVGSSSMPHKKNPITAEQICGVSRLLRGYVGPVMEDIALWQHRDLSHSSVERVAIPDAAALAEHLLLKSTQLCLGLEVDVKQMLRNVERAGRELASSRMLRDFLAAGMDRTEAVTASQAWVEGADGTEHEVNQDAAAPLMWPRLEPAVAVAVQEVLDSETLNAMFADVELLVGRAAKDLPAPC
ncbi:adenylosuccinate lyase [Nocardioides baculatus]|uniref:Adenylosuccinate lyase n=1 Tax=Nocardioides baculatus TaxID=2801337 RepID=A0ABS1L4V5_9ACTN|nr:adenylosuccinate lyase [Nocardioides baculatus]MBL0746726.1 adenylosuccinate lyase [Nocardioides baculatus]